MTKREFFTAIINGEQNEELQNFAKEELKKLENVYVKRTYKTKTKNEEINKDSGKIVLLDYERNLQ